MEIIKQQTNLKLKDISIIEHGKAIDCVANRKLASRAISFHLKENTSKRFVQKATLIHFACQILSATMHTALFPRIESLCVAMVTRRCSAYLPALRRSKRSLLARDGRAYPQVCRRYSFVFSIKTPTRVRNLTNFSCQLPCSD